MKKLMSTILLGLFLLVACSVKNITTTETVPFVIKNNSPCYVEYKIGRGIDKNGDKTITGDEWFLTIYDTLEPQERAEYKVYPGFYIGFFLVTCNGKTERQLISGFIPSPELKPNEKTVLIFEANRETTGAGGAGGAGYGPELGLHYQSSPYATGGGLGLHYQSSPYAGGEGLQLRYGASQQSAAGSMSGGATSAVMSGASYGALD